MRICSGLLLCLVLARPCVAQPGPYDPPIPETASALDRIYRHYGTGCFGMDWRILRAIARLESLEDPALRHGENTGLFQLGPGSSRRSDCGAYIRPFRKLFKCADLPDPELNTAVAAHRLHHVMTGERLRSKDNFKKKRRALSLIRTCPKNSVADYLVFYYLRLLAGAELFEHLLRTASKEPKACRPGKVLEGAVASFYRDHEKARSDGRYRSKARLMDCADRDEVVGRKTYLCVTADTGIRLYRRAVERSRELDLGEDEDRVTDFYPRHHLDHSQCPPFFKDKPRRVFKCRERLIRVYLESTDDPCRL